MKKQKINIQIAALSMAALLGVTSLTNAQNLGISATGVAPDPSAVGISFSLVTHLTY
jgi:hypothetical protein